MERLILTLPCERGELYYNLAGRRVLLANCTPVIKIYEHSSQAKAIGGGSIRHIHAALAICENADFTREVTTDFVKSIESFDLSTDIQRKDGVFEVFHFRNMQLQNIELDYDWVFELNEKQEIFRKLLAL